LQSSKAQQCKNRGGVTTAVIAMVDELRTWENGRVGPFLAVVFAALFAANT